MIFGNKAQFAIECYHDLIEGHRHWVFGRMCFWINEKKLGDLDEKQCALCVTKGHIDEALKLLGEPTI